MDDLISRQDAIDVADAIWSITGDKNVAEVWDRIRNLPSAQPEIIRCKDCKWFNEIGCAIRIVDDSDKPKENDYCSFGERKDD